MLSTREPMVWSRKSAIPQIHFSLHKVWAQQRCLTNGCAGLTLIYV